MNREMQSHLEPSLSTAEIDWQNLFISTYRHCLPALQALVPMLQLFTLLWLRLCLFQF